jgi:nucleoid-associated protein YgaU
VCDIRFFIEGEAALSGSTIGIKIADGSYYPILEEEYTGKKRLTLTTVKDNQGKVQIDLYRGGGNTLVDAQYIGSLIIENIPPASKGQPDIELLLGLDANGELTAEANDASTGESQSFAISLKTLSAEETYAIPEFEMEGGAMKPPETPRTVTGESYPVGETDRRRERVERGRSRVPLIVLFVVLGVALLAAIGWFLYKSVWLPSQQGTPVAAAPAPAAPAPATETPAPAATAPAPEASGTAATTTGTVSQTQSQAGGVAETPKQAEPAKPAGGVTYLIKKGDTLWDISSTYYRNPWLYPKLAAANKIKNPDLIFAGTTIYIPEE